MGFAGENNERAWRTTTEMKDVYKTHDKTFRNIYAFGGTAKLKDYHCNIDI